MSCRIVAVLSAAVVFAMPAGAGAQAATAARAARVTAGCLRDRGWRTSVTGRTVRATSPRVRPRGSFPRRPTFRVQFTRLPGGRFVTVQVASALNDRETLTAKHCVNRGKHA